MSAPPRASLLAPSWRCGGPGGGSSEDVSNPSQYCVSGRCQKAPLVAGISVETMQRRVQHSTRQWGYVNTEMGTVAAFADTQIIFLFVFCVLYRAELTISWEEPRISNTFRFYTIWWLGYARWGSNGSVKTEWKRINSSFHSNGQMFDVFNMCGR